MRKRLRKKLLCPLCNSRNILKLKAGGIHCFQCEKEFRNLSREIMSELGEKFPFIKAFNPFNIF